MPQYWLIKTEPSTYSFSDLERDGQTTWDGIKNALALIHLRAMREGDGVLVYHSGKDKAAVGRGIVVGPPRTDGKVTVVDVRCEGRLKAPVTLAQIRQEPDLAGLPLMRNTRLSVMPVTAEEWEAVDRLSRVAAGS